MHQDNGVAGADPFNGAAVARHFGFEGLHQIEKIDLELTGKGRRQKRKLIAISIAVICGGSRKNVSSAHDARQSSARINVDRYHQVQAQQRQVGQVVSRKLFTAEVRVYTTQAAKTISSDAHALEIRQFN